MYSEKLIKELIVSIVFSFFIVGIVFLGDNSTFLNADKSINYGLLVIILAIVFLIIFVLFYFFSSGELTNTNDYVLP